VEFHFGELSPRVGFIVTNLETDNPAVVRFYNKRETTKCASGRVCLRTNPGNLWRRLWLVLPRRIDNWSLTSLQQRLAHATTYGTTPFIRPV